ncbi:MAG: hypothetical protein K0U72_17225 [Gammaproteobacteria bacterium]|nr:hypothetical protein [Gammaproteobacteria bacterium]
MTKYLWTPLLIALLAAPLSAAEAEDLDKWFRDGYAALYVENAWDKADEFAQYFSDEIAFRSDDGLSVLNVDSFVIDSLDVWRSEGWLGTDVAALETTKLNATTAVFDVTWLDRNNDGSTELSCGWYFADKVDGSWLLSQYIAMTCAE